MPRPTVIERARTLLEKCIPPTVCGTSSCHNVTYRAACALVWGFGLTTEEAGVLLREWADRGTHHWKTRDLWHKCTSALGASHKEARGHLVDEGDDRGSLPDYGVTAAPKAARKPKCDPERLQAVQRADWKVDATWLRERSPVDPRAVTAGAFFDGLYEPGDLVMVFTSLRGQGDYMWRAGSDDFPADSGRPADSASRGRPGESFVLGQAPDIRAKRAVLPTGGREGMWFLIQPVDGQWYPKPRAAQMSRRTKRSVKAWRYLMMESDKVPMWQWLNWVCQLKLPICAIVESGNQGAHVLMRLQAADEGEWEGMRDMIVPSASVYGTDPDSLKSLVYMRLPGAWREGKVRNKRDAKGETVRDGKGRAVQDFVPFSDGRHLQRLLYFNPRPASIEEYAQGVAKPIGEGERIER